MTVYRVMKNFSKQNYLQNYKEYCGSARSIKIKDNLLITKWSQLPLSFKNITLTDYGKLKH